jgi:gliding motility-associated-like protein
MKRLLLYLVLFIVNNAMGQNIDGLWQGVLYQGVGSYFRFNMNLTQSGNSITGNSRIETVGNPYWGAMSLSGSFNSGNNTFTFQETSPIDSQLVSGFFWCIKNGNLIYDPVLEKLEGPWDGNSCTPGIIEIWRLKLLSDTNFCIGEEINLEVTGQDVKWYSDYSLNNLIGIGNSFSPNITESTTYYVTQTHYNTESPPFQININILPQSSQILNAVICEGEEFEGYEIEGTYIDTFQNTNSCDSIRIINLQILPVPIQIQNISICQGESILGYNSTGIYIDTLESINLCDSISILNLTVNESYITNETLYICNGDTIDGFFEEGIYTQNLTTIYGCDSLVNKTILIIDPDSTFLQANICQGESFEGYSESGAYIDIFTNIYNCDSVRTLNLNVFPTSSSEINIQICEGDTYEGYTFQGTYNDTLTNINGCDSIRVLNLAVSEKYIFRDTVYICLGEKYNYQNEEIINPGTYEFNYQTINGCDSIYVLNLLQINPNILNSDTTVCSNSSFILKSPYPNTVWFDGRIGITKEVFETGIYTCSVTSESGCEVRDTVLISIRPTIYLPNGFTPNNDNLNDYFIPKYIKDKRLNIEINIFNRFGDLIFNYKGDDPLWNGYYNQILCQDGVYVVQLKSTFLGCNDEIFIDKITLISHD